MLALPAAAAAAAAQGAACPRGDAWSLSIDAERALELGAWPEAARDYACAARESTDAAVAERATRTAYDNLQLERAVESARRWLLLLPSSEVARRYLATSLLRVYDEEGAAEQFTALLETSYADRARGYLVLLGILSGEDNDTGAARVMEGLAADGHGAARGPVRRGDAVAACRTRREGARRGGAGARAAARLPAGRVRARARAHHGRPPRRGARPLGEARRDWRPVHAARPRLAAPRRGAARRRGRPVRGDPARRQRRFGRRGLGAGLDRDRRETLR